MGDIIGGRGSGGHNRTHDQAEQRKRIDSFSITEMIKLDKYSAYKDVIRTANVLFYPATMTAETDSGEELEIEESNANIDGHTKRFYFICPCCGRAARFLYQNPQDKLYYCRLCENLNYKSQQLGGEKRLESRMESIAKGKLRCYNWRDYGGDIIAPATPQKPKYMRQNTYKRLASQYERLASQYDLCFISKFFSEIKAILQD